MSDEKQEIVIPDEYRELYENAVLSTGRNFMSAKDVRILIERVAGLIMQAKRDCKSISESKQAFEDLRIADQATLTETLAAALEQSLRAEKAEAERDAAIELAAWINVEDRLPPNKVLVLAWNKIYKRPFVAWIDDKGWNGSFSEEIDYPQLPDADPTHWSLLNAPSIVAEEAQ